MIHSSENAFHYKLKSHKTCFRNCVREGDGIIDFAKSEKIDLTVMVTHTGKRLAHLFNIGIKENVVNHIQRPFGHFFAKLTTSEK